MRIVSLLVAALCACRTEQTIVTPDPHLNRMLKQEKLAFPNWDKK